MKAIPEFHQQGNISIENVQLIGISGDTAIKGDLGVQVAADGRVWICIDGVAFLRFSPHLNGQMNKGRY